MPPPEAAPAKVVNLADALAASLAAARRARRPRGALRDRREPSLPRSRRAVAPGRASTRSGAHGRAPQEAGRRVSPRRAVEVEIEGRRLELSNLDKVLYPQAGFTKGAVIDYYTRIAPALLPHLRDRPLTLKRYPNGVEGSSSTRSAARRTARRGSGPRRVERGQRGRTSDFCLVERPGDPGLGGEPGRPRAAHRPCTGRRGGAPHRAGLRPRPRRAGRCRCSAARWRSSLRGLFERLGLQSFPKTSGSKGLQVYVPLNTATGTYEPPRPSRRAVAELLERAASGAGRLEHEEGAAGGEGVRGLEPERRPQDDRLRLLAAREGAADRLDAAALERGRAAARARDAAPLVFDAPAALARVAKRRRSLRAGPVPAAAAAGAGQPGWKCFAPPQGCSAGGAIAGRRRASSTSEGAREKGGPRQPSRAPRRAGPGGRRPPSGHRPRAPEDGYLRRTDCGVPGREQP